MWCGRLQSESMNFIVIGIWDGEKNAGVVEKCQIQCVDSVCSLCCAPQFNGNSVRKTISISDLDETRAVRQESGVEPWHTHNAHTHTTHSHKKCPKAKKKFSPKTTIQINWTDQRRRYYTLQSIYIYNIQIQLVFKWPYGWPSYAQRRSNQMR